MNKEGEKEQAEFLNSENQRMINYHSCQRSDVTLKGTVSENHFIYIEFFSSFAKQGAICDVNTTIGPLIPTTFLSIIYGLIKKYYM